MRFFKSILFCLFFLLLVSTLSAQLTGTVRNEKGELLPFANVFIENTTRGTTANTEGVFFLDLKNGSYSVVFQYVGYKKLVKKIEVEGKTVVNIQLEPVETQLSEFVVKANAEDPAYPIIRKAIEMRRTYRDQSPNYVCDVYIKGVQKIYDVPQKIMGQKVGDMDGMIDSLQREGIIYLSETKSKYYVQGEKRREELLLSKVSGNDNGFSFNRATLFDFSFYENYINISRQLLSPIADNAFTYYKYRLVSTTRDEIGRDIYKIEVLPKRKEDPTWADEVYIIDNQWNLYATDLYVTGKSISQSILDTLRMRQSFVETDKVWRPFAQNISFKLGILGIKFKGSFDGVFSNYDLTPQYPSSFFSNETYNAEKIANKNNDAQWDTLRPIALTEEENRDYMKKDSIRQVRQTKPYVDSVAAKSNRFKPLSLLTGYTYSDPWNNWSLGFQSPLNSLTFNPVQGFNMSLDVKYRKEIGERFQPYKSTIEMTPSVSYGFSDERVRASLNAVRLMNRFNYATWRIEGGQKVTQFSEEDPVTRTVAELFALFDKRHLLKVYDKTFAKIGFSQDITNGLNVSISAEASERAPLSNTSEYSIRKKEERYNANVPEPVLATGWQKHRGFVGSVGLTWTPKNEYATYPNFKDNEGSRFPTFFFTV
ncbi:MAG: carboxypeptidase-like regulatory domain-containing protein [Saprospiraceae bacterium]|nr:carboxypeptidase-like regulatory domain-containing protein [Saprospiraceae bacterium]